MSSFAGGLFSENMFVIFLVLFILLVIVGVGMEN